MVNKVKQSKLETIDLEKFAEGIIIKELDIKDFLSILKILKEKEFRDKMDNLDWSQFDGAYLTVY